jgi:hypothetical protein
MVPMTRPAAAAPVRGFGARPMVRPGMPGVRAAFAGGVMGLSANGILLRPFPPVLDEPVEVSVQLANPDGAAETAKVRVSVGGEDLGEVTVNVPAGATAMATGFRAWKAANGRHDVRATVTAGARSGEATKAVFVTPMGPRGLGRPVAGGVAAMPGAPGARPMMTTGGRPTGGKAGMAPGGKGGASASGGAAGFQSPRAMPGLAAAPDLKLASADIRMTPATPAAGATAVVQITVRNLGAAPATGGQVLAVLTADGKEVARQQFAAAVPARGVMPLQWPITVPPGALSVTATATAPGDANPNNNLARSGAAPATAAPVMPAAPRGTMSLPTGGATSGKR